MGRPEDISDLLKDWAYKEDQNVRRLKTPSGREVLQVRLPLGIEQYELHGRPDGLKPEGFESWLEHYLHQGKVYGREFVLDKNACDHLLEEGILYYHRYLLFFQVQEFELCIRDTSRNLRLLKFVNEHAADSEQCEFLEQYRPYILRMQYMAKALLRVKEQGDIRGALRLLRQGSETIEALPDMPNNDVFDFERVRSLHSIRELANQLEEQLPLSPREELERELSRAVENENFEKAAEIRDRIRDMEDDLEA